MVYNSYLPTWLSKKYTAFSSSWSDSTVIFTLLTQYHNDWAGSVTLWVKPETKTCFEPLLQHWTNLPFPISKVRSDGLGFYVVQAWRIKLQWSSLSLKRVWSTPWHVWVVPIRTLCSLGNDFYSYTHLNMKACALFGPILPHLWHHCIPLAQPVKSYPRPHSNNNGPTALSLRSKLVMWRCSRWLEGEVEYGMSPKVGHISLIHRHSATLLVRLVLVMSIC